MGAVTVDRLSFRYPAGELGRLHWKGDGGLWVGVGAHFLYQYLGSIIPTSRGEIKGRSSKQKEHEKITSCSTGSGVGLVFQDRHATPTVEDEIAFAPENLCLPVEEVAAQVNNVLNSWESMT